MDNYQYRNLDHAKASFLHPRLHRGGRGKLTCNLFEALLHHDDILQYEALPYTWGASELPKTIDVYGKRLGNTENAYQALMNLRNPRQRPNTLDRCSLY
ncbi:hypothetical protein V8C37DRAFT_396818 [Trichoderma ceciliae]